MSRNTWMTCLARSLHLLAIGWRWSPFGIPHGLFWYYKPRFCENCYVKTNKVILSLYMNQQHSLRTLLCFQLWRFKCNKYIILMSHHSICIKKKKLKPNLSNSIGEASTMLPNNHHYHHPNQSQTRFSKHSKEQQK